MIMKKIWKCSQDNHGFLRIYWPIGRPVKRLRLAVTTAPVFSLPETLPGGWIPMTDAASFPFFGWVSGVLAACAFWLMMAILLVLLAGGIARVNKKWWRCCRCQIFFSSDREMTWTLPSGTPEPLSTGYCPVCHEAEMDFARAERWNETGD